MHQQQRTHPCLSGYTSTTESPSLLLRLQINNRELNLASPGIHQLYRKPKSASPNIHQQPRTHPCFSGHRATTENSTLLLRVQGTQTCFSEYSSTTDNPALPLQKIQSWFSRCLQLLRRNIFFLWDPLLLWFRRFHMQRSF